MTFYIFYGKNYAFYGKKKLNYGDNKNVFKRFSLQGDRCGH